MVELEVVALAACRGEGRWEVVRRVVSKAGTSAAAGSVAPGAPVEAKAEGGRTRPVVQVAVVAVEEVALVAVRAVAAREVAG